MNQYKITFHGFNGTESLTIESPHTFGCEDADLVDEVIDLAIEIGYLTFGADFRDRLDTYAIDCSPA